MHCDNPAARLLKLLQDGKKIQQGIKCRDGWRQLLGVESSESALLVSRLGKIMELPDIIINEIRENYPNQSNTHKHWSAKVNQAFMQQNLNGQWKEFIAHIDDHTISYLSMTADLLDMKSSTILMEKDELSDIREKVNGLLSQAIELNIDEDFRKYLVRYLRKIIITIDEYHISGAIPISEAIESALGHAFMDENYRKNISETDFGATVVSVLGGVAAAVTIAVGLPQLPDTFQYLISSKE